MAYESVMVGTTEYAIDWVVIHRLMRSYWTAKLQLEYGNEVDMTDSHWYNPLGWQLPDVSSVEVDWQAVRRDSQVNADKDIDRMRQQAKSDPVGVAYEIEDRIDEAAKLKEEYLDWMGHVQTQNMININNAVDAYEADIQIAKFVRDTSADGLMVGAAVMTGGAGTAVLGGGSFLKGVGKFQDRGSVGAGVMEAVGSFVFAYVKLGKSFSFKQDMVLALVQASWKTGTELVGGDTVGSAALQGALKLTGPSVDRLTKLGPAKTIFDKVAVPVEITYVNKNVGAEFFRREAAKFTQSQLIEKTARKKILSASASPTAAGTSTATSPRSGQGIIDNTTLTNKWLLYWSFVNQELGIGNGWGPRGSGWGWAVDL